jgi:hypothetical protein
MPGVRHDGDRGACVPMLSPMPMPPCATTSDDGFVTHTSGDGRAWQEADTSEVRGLHGDDACVGMTGAITSARISYDWTATWEIPPRGEG